MRHLEFSASQPSPGGGDTATFLDIVQQQRALRTDVQALDGRVGAVETQIVQLDERVGQVEVRLERVDVKLDRVQQDVQQMHVDLRDMRQLFDTRLDNSRTDLRTEISIFKAELRADLADFKGEFRDFRRQTHSDMRWMIGLMVAMLAAMARGFHWI